MPGIYIYKTFKCPYIIGSEGMDIWINTMYHEEKWELVCMLQNPVVGGYNKNEDYFVFRKLEEVKNPSENETIL